MSLALTLAPGREGVYAFDHRGTIKQQMIQRLSRFLGAKYGSKLAAVKSFHEELATATDLDQIERILLGRAPAVLVSTNRAQYRNRSSNRKTDECERLEIEVYVISSNLTSPEAALTGDASSVVDGDPGIDRLLSDVWAILFNFSAGGNWKPLVLEDEDFAARGLGAIAFKQRWITRGLRTHTPVDSSAPNVTKIAGTLNQVEQEGIQQ